MHDPAAWNMIAAAYAVTGIGLLALGAAIGLRWRRWRAKAGKRRDHAA